MRVSLDANARSRPGWKCFTFAWVPGLLEFYDMNPCRIER